MIDLLEKETLLNKCDYQPKSLNEISFDKYLYGSIRWIGGGSNYFTTIKGKSFRPSKQSIFKRSSANKFYYKYMYKDNCEIGGVPNQFRMSMFRTEMHNIIQKQ